MATPRGAARGYGFGLQFTNTAWGARGIYHMGGIIGFSAQNVWFPAESLSVTILFNSIGDGFPTNFILEVARAISPAAPQAAQPRTPAAPANLTRDRTIGAVVGIVRGADTTPPLSWVERLTFRQGAVLLTFRRANGISGTKLRYDTGTEHAILAHS
jgi:hypothetical protein